MGKNIKLISLASFLTFLLGMALVGTARAQESYPVSWITSYASLEASDLVIKISGQNYHGEAGSLRLHSDPGNNTYTTLEAEWYENGRPMRLYFYFSQNDTDWKVTEVRTYDGSERGEWLFYNGFSGSKKNTRYYNQLQVLTSKDGRGEISFSDFNLVAFPVRPLPPYSEKGYSLEPLNISQNIKIIFRDDLPPWQYSYGVNVLLRSAKDGQTVTDQSNIIYRWLTEDPRIASVEAGPLCAYGIKPPCPNINGQIRAYATGRTRITAQAEDRETQEVLATAVIPVIIARATVVNPPQPVVTVTPTPTPVACFAVNRAIPAVNPLGLTCCTGLTLVPPTDDNIGSAGVCRQWCGSDSDCRVEEVCASEPITGQGLFCESQSLVKMRALEKDLSATKKDLEQLKTGVQKQEATQNQLVRIVNNILSFLKNLFGFRSN
ncbi:MAG: hypothetical protein AAB486_02785 [Patescibacteria group bacterium]